MSTKATARIYHALYRIGKRYGLLTRKSPEVYLRVSYRTCLQMFQTDPWGRVGVRGGGNAVNILEDLEKEGWQEEHGKLREAMRQCNEVFRNDPYPYASEYCVDTTAHEQVYFFTRYFDNTEENLKTLQITKALRGGNQPVWFQYGNDNKGDLTCWYTESTNGWALLRGFEDTGDLDTLIKGFAGVMSVEVDLLPDGTCFAHFICTPGVFDFVPPRTLDSGIAQGEVDQVALSEAGKRLELRLSDSTGVVKKAELELKGLEKGEYLVRYGSSADRMRVSDVLQLSLPIADAKLIRIEKV